MTVDLQAKHKEFKEKVVEIFHARATKESLCHTFDSLLHEMGLPGRESYYKEYLASDQAPLELVGEPTEEEFEAWRLGFARQAHKHIAYYGLGSWTQTVLREAGFPTSDELYETVNIKAEGTFVIPMVLEVAKGDDVINYVDKSLLARAISNGIRFDSVPSSDFAEAGVTWKAVVVGGKTTT